MAPVLLAVLAGCAAESTFAPVSATEREIAKQRVRFLVEAACFNEDTGRGQRRVLDREGFAIRNRTGDQFFYGDPQFLVFSAVGDRYDLQFEGPDGRTLALAGTGCTVGSPAISHRDANEIVSQVLGARVLSATRAFPEPVAIGENEVGGVGFLLQGLAVTVQTAAVGGEPEGGGAPQSFPIVDIVVVRP